MKSLVMPILGLKRRRMKKRREEYKDTKKMPEDIKDESKRTRIIAPAVIFFLLETFPFISLVFLI